MLQGMFEEMYGIDQPSDWPEDRREDWGIPLFQRLQDEGAMSGTALKFIKIFAEKELGSNILRIWEAFDDVQINSIIVRVKAASRIDQAQVDRIRGPFQSVFSKFWAQSFTFGFNGLQLAQLYRFAEAVNLSIN